MKNKDGNLPFRNGKKADDLSTLTGQVSNLSSSLVESAKKLTNYVNVLAFGADPTGNSDCVTAFKNAISYMIANEINVLYIPTGKYKIMANSNTKLELPSYCSVVGDGDNSVIKFDDNPSISKTYLGSSLFYSNNSKYIEFSDFKIEGSLYDYLSSGETNAVPFVYLTNCEEIVFNNVTLYGSRKLNTQMENAKRVKLTNNKVMNSLRDGFRCINASNVIANGNYFYNVSDDSIAIQSNTAFTEVNTGVSVVNNIFEFSQGISCFGGKIINIIGNTFKRSPYSCIGVSYSTDAEGNSPIHSINISDNLITDKLYTSWGGAEIISINSQSITLDGANKPSVNTAPYAYNYLKGSNITGLPACHSLNISNNKIIRTLPLVAKISDWGYGSILTKDVVGYVYDDAITDYSFSGYGLSIKGSIYNANISDNIFAGIGSSGFLGTGILFDNTSSYISRYDVKIKNNQFYDLTGVAIKFNTGINANVFVENNLFDLDPFFRNEKHNSDNSWVANSSGYSSGLGGNLKGVICKNNYFANCFNPMTSSPTVKENNYAFTDGKASTYNTAVNKGVDVLGDVTIILIHGTPSEINFREIYESVALVNTDGSITTSVGDSLTATPTANTKRITSEIKTLEVGKKYTLNATDSNLRVWTMFGTDTTIQTTDVWHSLPYTFTASYVKGRFLFKHNDDTDITSSGTSVTFMS